MVVMKYFCFYFPVRLGVLITSALSFLQAAFLLIYFFIYDVKYFGDMVKDIQENIEDYSSNEAFDSFLDYTEKNTEQCRLGMLIFNGSLMIACIINAMAALKIWRWLTVPYILLDFVRLCALLACHIVLMMIYKKQINLGVLIGASSAGGFIILFMGYMWSCSIALFQIVGVVQSKKYQKFISLGSPAPEKTQRNVTISSIKIPNIIKPPIMDSKNDSFAVNGMFASDFSEYYRKPTYRM